MDDLNHLKRGGRINAATALFGTMLAIKPVMHVDDEGRLIPVSKARGRKASLTALPPPPSCHCNGQIVQLLLIRPTRLAGRGPLLWI